jgi:hypothetical protein
MRRVARPETLVRTQDSTPVSFYRFHSGRFMLNEIFHSPIGKFLLALGLLCLVFLALAISGAIPVVVGVMIVLPITIVINFLSHFLVPPR